MIGEEDQAPLILGSYVRDGQVGEPSSDFDGVPDFVQNFVCVSFGAFDLDAIFYVSPSPDPPFYEHGGVGLDATGRDCDECCLLLIVEH